MSKITLWTNYNIPHTSEPLEAQSCACPDGLHTNCYLRQDADYLVFKKDPPTPWANSTHGNFCLGNSPKSEDWTTIKARASALLPTLRG